MERGYDLIVLGTGVAGSTVAEKCSAAGWKVAIVDNQPFGGTCALRGCDPKKVLVLAADLVDAARRMRGKGVELDGAGLVWEDLIRFKRTFTDPVPERTERRFQEQGIDVYHGQGRFVARTRLKVGEDELSAHRIVIATGARPRPLGIQGEEHLTYSDQFLDLDALPGRILFIGGGYISFEFSHAASSAGAQVRICHRSDRMLKRFDPELVDMLVQTMGERGVEVLPNMPVHRIERAGGGLLVHAGRGEREEAFEADLVVHGAGREPQIEGLDLEKGGVAGDGRGVKVNDYLQSVTNPAVYACGDVVDRGAPLTPVARLQGRVVARNLLHGNRQYAHVQGAPSVVFTFPRLASVGLLEEQARERDQRFQVRRGDSTQWQTNRRRAVQHAGYKVLVEEQTEQILGAHLLDPNAAEMINLFALAIRAGLTTGELEDMIPSYPSGGSNLPYML